MIEKGIDEWFCFFAFTNYNPKNIIVAIPHTFVSGPSSLFSIQFEMTIENLLKIIDKETEKLTIPLKKLPWHQLYIRLGQKMNERSKGEDLFVVLLNTNIFWQWNFILTVRLFNPILFSFPNLILNLESRAEIHRKFSLDFWSKWWHQKVLWN